MGGHSFKSALLQEGSQLRAEMSGEGVPRAVGGTVATTGFDKGSLCVPLGTCCGSTQSLGLTGEES